MNKGHLSEVFSELLEVLSKDCHQTFPGILVAIVKEGKVELLRDFLQLAPPELFSYKLFDILLQSLGDHPTYSTIDFLLEEVKTRFPGSLFDAYSTLISYAINSNKLKLLVRYWHDDLPSYTSIFLIRKMSYRSFDDHLRFNPGMLRFIIKKVEQKKILNESIKIGNYLLLDGVDKISSNKQSKLLKQNLKKLILFLLSHTKELQLDCILHKYVKGVGDIGRYTLSEIICSLGLSVPQLNALLLTQKNKHVQDIIVAKIKRELKGQKKK